MADDAGGAVLERGDAMTYFWPFVLIQALDAATTLIGLRLGGYEANGVLAGLFAVTGPAAGLCIAKAFGLILALLVYLRGHRRVYRDCCVIFGAVVAWNCAMLVRMLA